MFSAPWAPSALGAKAIARAAVVFFGAKMSEAELEGINAGRGSQFVHEAFASEGVGGGGEAPIGAVAQRRTGLDGAAGVFVIFDPV